MLDQNKERQKMEITLNHTIVTAVEMCILKI